MGGTKADRTIGGRAGQHGRETLTRPGGRCGYGKRANVAVLLLHVEVEIVGGKERGGVLKNSIVAIGDCQGLVNGEWRIAPKEGVSCTILARRQCKYPGASLVQLSWCALS